MKTLLKIKKHENLKRRNLCERTVSGVNVNKISSRQIEKWPSFDILKVENGHFSCCFLIFF